MQTSRLNLVDRNYFRQWILAAGLLVLLGIVTAYDIFRDYRRTQAVEYDRLRVQARVIDESLDRQLVAIYAALQGLLNDLPSLREGNSYKPVARLMLKTIEEGMPGVMTLSIIDARGRARAASRPELIDAVLADRDYFQDVRRHPDPAALYLSPPYATIPGIYTMNASRMISGRDREFAGVVSATLDPDYFKTLLASVQYAPDMWVAVAHGDGIQFLMVPDRPGQSGKDLALPGSFFSRHRASGKDENILSGTVYATGEERVMALRTIHPAGAHLDKPLVLAVGRDLHDLFSDWRRNAMIYGSVYFGIVAITLISLRYYQIRVRWADERLRLSTAALQESEHRYRILAENTTDVVWQLDLSTMKYTYVSPSVFSLRGYTAEEVMSQPVDASLTPESQKNVRAWIADTLEEFSRGRTDPHAGLKEVEQPRKNGTTVWTEVAITYILNDEHRPNAVIGISRDITERRNAELAVKENETRFRAVFENSVDAIGISQSGVHVFVNSAYLALFGYAQTDDLTGKPILDLIAPEERPVILDRIRRRARGVTVPSHYETHGLRKNGQEFVLDVNVSTYELGGVTYTLVIMRDISERKMADEIIRGYSRDLERLIAISRETTLTTDLKSLYRTFVSASQELLRFDFSSLMLLSDDKKTLTVEDCIGFPGNSHFSLVEGQGLPTLVIMHKKPETVQDFSRETRFDVPAIIHECNIASAVAVPMMMQDEVIGVLVGHTRERRNFTTEQIAMYQHIANQAAVAVRNAMNALSLQAGEKKLSVITACQGEGLYVIDNAGLATFMNPEAERLLGWTEAELRGKNIHDLVHSRKPNGAYMSYEECPMRTVVETGERFMSRDEVFVSRAGKTFPVSLISAPIRETGRIVASVTSFRDISERKQLEVEREKLIVDLQKALSEIRTLHGILPICSYCKKIRDEAGAWKQLETYISEHTDAIFSHGMCAECARKKYPQFYRKDLDQNGGEK